MNNNKNKKRLQHNKKEKAAIDKTFTVEEEKGLLDFLYENLKGMSANKVKSTLKYKLVSVNGKITTKFDYMLKKGQTVTIGTYKPVYSGVDTSDLPDILFEDEDLLVINKPSGMLSIADDKEKLNTAYHIMNEYVKQKNSNARIYVVHRLDKDTSGILMFAKNADIKTELQDNWEDLVKLRGYSALVEGCPERESGRIESWLRETDTRLVYSARSDGDGKHAVTNYTVARKGEYYSLLDVNIETGRKNQIRVHMKDIGCPIAGDKKYDAKTNPIHRLGLHAGALTFIHPYTNEEMHFETPIPKKMLTGLKIVPESKKKNSR